MKLILELDEAEVREIAATLNALAADGAGQRLGKSTPEEIVLESWGDPTVQQRILTALKCHQILK